MRNDRSLTLKTSALGGWGTQTFVTDLTWVGDWSRSTVSEGGYWLGKFSLGGKDIGAAFDTWMGYDVEERCGTTSWNGMVYELELSRDGVVRRRSFDDMWNRVRAHYTDVDGVEQDTAWAEDALSVAMYGYKEQIIEPDTAQGDIALQMRDRYLQEHAWPWPRFVSLSNSRETKLTVTVAGYVYTANWRYMSAASATEDRFWDGPGAAGTFYLPCPGGCGFARPAFQDPGGAWAPYETIGPGTAAHSMWWTQGATSGWAYVADLAMEDDGGGPDLYVHLYQTQYIANPPPNPFGSGWYGTCVGAIGADTYRVRSPVSEWIPMLANDCQYLDLGAADWNPTQVQRDLNDRERVWDAIKRGVELGDAANQPWRAYVHGSRLLSYRLIDATMPNRKYRTEWLNIGESLASPWVLVPAVVRDLSWRSGRDRPGYWLPDRRDFYVEEFEIGPGGSVSPRVADTDQSEMMQYRLEALYGNIGGKPTPSGAGNPYKGFNSYEEWKAYQDWWQQAQAYVQHANDPEWQKRFGSPYYPGPPPVEPASGSGVGPPVGYIY